MCVCWVILTDFNPSTRVRLQVWRGRKINQGTAASEEEVKRPLKKTGQMVHLANLVGYIAGSDRGCATGRNRRIVLKNGVANAV
jgi:hypothetical protein